MTRITRILLSVQSAEIRGQVENNVTKGFEARLNEQAAIVSPSRHPSGKATRRVMRRRKARACAKLCICFAVFWAVVKLWALALASSAKEPGQSQWAGVLLAILGVGAIASAVLAILLKFTEKPSETLVRTYSADDLGLPVIHAREK
jgi:hypothetical protein